MAEAARRVARDKVDASQVIIGKAWDTIRPLGSVEHLFWLIDQNRPAHFAVTAQISGEATPRDWRKALDRVQERHPLLSVCIDGRPGSVPRFRQADAAPIPLRIVEKEPRSRWEHEVGVELATPFDPSQAPLMRAVLIQGVRDAAFMLVAHHAIADGLSLAYAIRDTLGALASGFLEPLPLSSSQDDILGVPAGLESTQEPQDDALAWDPAVYRAQDGAHPKVKGLRLPPALTASVRDRARQEGTTVHGALCAALVSAGRQVSADWREIPLRIMSPINTRQLLDVGESCGVFVGAATGVFDGQPMDFWDLARDAKAGVAAGQTREGVAALISALQQVVGNGADIAVAAEFTATAFAHEAMLTNLGTLSFGSQFGPMKLEALWGPAVLSGIEGEQTIGAATVDGGLCLTHTSHTPPAGLLEAMQSVLVEACAT